MTNHLDDWSPAQKVALVLRVLERSLDVRCPSKDLVKFAMGATESVAEALRSMKDGNGTYLRQEIAEAKGFADAAAMEAGLITLTTTEDEYMTKFGCGRRAMEQEVTP